MVHFSHATLAHRAVVSSQRLDAETARTAVDDLAWIGGHLLDVLGRGVAERHCARIGEHGGEMGGEREEYERVEQDGVEQISDRVRRRQDHDEHDDELGVEYEKPRDARAYHAARVFDAPRARHDQPRTPAARTVAAVLVTRHLVVVVVVVVVVVRVIVVVVVVIPRVFLALLVVVVLLADAVDVTTAAAAASTVLTRRCLVQLESGADATATVAELVVTPDGERMHVSGLGAHKTQRMSERDREREEQ